MREPLLSVCLITYNHARYIRQAVEGVLMQKVNFAWELVIADDFSTDGTREILIDYKDKYPDFIKLILQKENVGASRNWHDLIETPKSRYIAYFEGDDYWTDSSKLQRQVDFLETNPDFAISFHNLKIINEKHPTLSRISNKKQKEITDIHDLAKRNYIYTASCVFRNQKQAFPEWFSQCPVGDYPFHLLNARFGKIKFFKEIMGVYRIHSGGIWENTSLQSRQMKWIQLLDILVGKFDPQTNEILSAQKYILEKINKNSKTQKTSKSFFLNYLEKKFSLSAKWHFLKSGIIEKKYYFTKYLRK